jgi:UDP-glucose 4-epimerase
LKALVTGGAGFIGSNLVDALLKKGFSITVIDNEYSNSHKEFYWNPRAHNFKLDIRNYKETRNLYEGIDYVFHLAAETRIQPSILDPINTISINSLGTCTVLQCAYEAKVKRVVFSSTSAIYGRNPSPNQEIQPADCLNPYAISKYEGEQLCKMYYELFGLETVVLRYFNVYGDRQPVRGTHAPVVGVFLNQREEGKPLTVVGEGRQRRDFVNVGDVANANIAAAETLLDSKYFGTVFNIGSGINYSVLEIAKMISTKIEMISARLGESLETFADISKANEILNWAPTIYLPEWLKEN